MAMTVTATQGGAAAPANGMGMTVLVLGGAKAAVSQPGGVKIANNPEVTPFYDQSVIVQALGSWILGAITDGDTNLAYTPDANTTMLENFASAAHACTFATFRSTAATAATGAATYGATNATGGQHGAYAAAEILAATTISQDASTPSPASSETDTATSLTSASFTPAAGALIAVMVSANGNNTAETITISDTAGLTWKQLAFTAGDSYTASGVWVADAPSGGTGAILGAAGSLSTASGGTGAILGAAGSLGTAATQGAGAVLGAAGSLSAAAARYLSGIAADSTGGHFVDNTGQPILWVFDWMEGLLTNAGRWNGSGGGTYQQDFDNYCAGRAAQGLTVVLIEPVGTLALGGAFDNGNTWDGVAPFTSTSPVTLNSTYWARLDYLLASAQRNGITVAVILDIEYVGASSGQPYFGWTTTQFQQYGAALGARYASTPNLIWECGDDSVPGTFDSSFTAFLTGLSSAGDTHVVGALWAAEYTSRYKTDTSTAASWGVTNSAFNNCYSYNAGYWIIEYAYGEVANQGAAKLLPAVMGDGYHYQGGSTYSSTFDRAYRQEAWWVLAAGGRGILTYDVAAYNWDAGTCPAAITSAWFFANNLKNIVSYYSSLAGWHKLLPDLSSTFVTAGRGTRVTGFTAGGTGGAYEPAFTNNWVAASITADGTLAVCYLPAATTITVDTAKLASGWTATWVDPITAATSSAGSGPTFSSTTKGANSHGDPDWVLVFTAPAAAGTASLGAAGSLSTTATQGAGAVLGAAGSLPAPAAVQGAPASLAAAGSLNAAAAQGAGTVLGAAGSLAAATTLTVTTTSLPAGTQGAPYSQTLAATGGTPPYTWQVISGSLPAGLGLS